VDDRYFNRSVRLDSDTMETIEQPPNMNVQARMASSSTVVATVILQMRKGDPFSHALAQRHHVAQP